MSHGLDEQRSFGRGVGTVAALLGVWLFVRGRSGWLAPALLAVGLALVVLGQFAPRVLTHPARAWMALAHALGWVSTRVILSVLFFGVITPIGVWKRLRGFDPLDRHGPSRDSHWVPYPERQQDPTYYERMF